jgi:hypothetical protein
MISNILQQWEDDKIVIHILEEADLKLQEDEGFSAFSIVEVNRKPRLPSHSQSEMVIRLDMSDSRDPVELKRENNSLEYIRNIDCMRIINLYYFVLLFFISKEHKIFYFIKIFLLVLARRKLRSV